MKNSIPKSRLLNRQDIKTLSLSSLGGTLEFYDFIIFVFFAQTIAHLFYPATLDPFLSTLNTYGTFAAGYFARPLGGIVMAHLGDKNGRKNMFMLSILLMVIPTFLMGILPTYESIGYFAPIILLLIRIFQGIAIGGELPGAWVFVCEHTHKNRLGFSIGVLTSCVVGGILLGSIVAFCINFIFDSREITQYAWRIPFLLGGLFGIISIFLRRYLHETPIFQEMKRSDSLVKIPIKKVFQTAKINIMISMLSTWILTGCIVVLILLVPNIMKSTLSTQETHIILIQMLAIFSLIIGCILSGGLADKIGISKACIVFSFAFAITSLIFFYTLYHCNDNKNIFMWYVIVAFFAGVMNFTPLTMLCIFPPNIRFSGLSFSYNLAYAIFGGFAPILVVNLNAYNPILVGYYLAFLGVIGIFIGIFIYFFQKSEETR
ncbi:MFS transporter [Helicobacter sp. 13S00482-2]|uniref:MFS transporter n=1 Tax=Helicobacter sp. 13S00482-2 TaxID=1476200 RepID=UPI000BA7973D|nr:MFS transporter [Helicobacter sp. 13S00482-2]PAF54148.1 MFS transporter [Helicobacter sp. 13S00482-2]